MTLLRVIQLIVVALYCWACCFIALRSKGDSNSLEDYIRPKLGPWTVALTGFATAFSTSIVVVGASFGYRYGAAAIWVAVPQALGLAVMYLLFAGPLNDMSNKLGSLTVSEFLGERYKSKTIRVVAAAILFIFCIGNLLVIYRGLGLIITQVMQCPYWLAVVISGLLASWYTAYGGQIAVARTDALQGWIMTAGMLILIPIAIIKGGGMSAIHLKLAEISPNLVQTPGNFQPGIFLGLAFVFSFGMLGQPQLIFRCMFIKRKRDIPLIAVITFVLSIISCWVSYYSGVAGRAIIPGTLTDPDMTMPIMMTTLYHPIVAAVLMTAMAAAAMSTTSSILIMATTAVTRDIYQKIVNPTATDEKVRRISFWLNIFLGIVGTIGALKPPSWFIFIMAFVWAVWTATYMFPILYGLYWKGVTTAGALTGMIIGPIVAVAWKLANQPYGIHPLFPAVLVSIIIIPLVSLFTPKLPAEFVDYLFAKGKVGKEKAAIEIAKGATENA